MDPMGNFVLFIYKFYKKKHGNTKVNKVMLKFGKSFQKCPLDPRNFPSKTR